MLLHVTALAAVALAIYQWVELVMIRTSGAVATCDINETLSCSRIWNSAFASAVHKLFGVPVAGLGVVWGLTALGLAFLLRRKVTRGEPLHPMLAMNRLWAALGVLSCITFAVASFRAGGACPTCLGTYAVVVAHALVAHLMLPKSKTDSEALRLGAPVVAALAGGTWLLALYPGTQTPKSSSMELGGPEEKEVAAYFQKLPPQMKQQVAAVRALWQAAPQPDTSAFQPHHFEGPKDAPVKLVEFTDVLCSHCKTLLENLDAMKRGMPATAMSIESRHFPLDSECNPQVSQSMNNGVRCLAARMQVCLEKTDKLEPVRSALFANQEELRTTDRVWELALAAGVNRDEVEACVKKPETQARIEEDVRYAMLFNPRGTPVVLLNGRMIPPNPAFIYGMAMGKGDPNNKYFKDLPEPPR
jgi:protein-disulfide isomerase/uncharacterized membrane protein